MEQPPLNQWEPLFHLALSFLRTTQIKSKEETTDKILTGLFHEHMGLISNSRFAGVPKEALTKDPDLCFDASWEAAQKRCFYLHSAKIISEFEFHYRPNYTIKGEVPQNNQIKDADSMKVRAYGDCDNRLKAILRHRNKFIETSDENVMAIEEPGSSPRDGVFKKESLELVRTALNQLAKEQPKWAEAVRLKYLENKSQQDIANQLSVGVSTISDWIGEKGLQLALKELRKIIIKLQK
ncbi:RNA polymerase sigma factor [Roseibacillus persicicus]|uniref:RNA polymerase sigma factor n=1 Tax=Roseibacillus persicicus TaxID=454148 RepID=UPI0028100698|nr:sigma-70 family RNA polymerase sigma factor [Roseibacillus persicicus]MDQ8192355.1 sigma-70 family RNA polymerase sigma factor [Roseibacillus persicicus]